MSLRRLLDLLRPGRPRPSGPRYRVLVATSPGVRDALAPILADCPVEFVCEMDDGVRALAGGPFSHVVVGYLFAESQMFEFVRHVRKAQPAARVVCVKAVGRKLSPGTRAGLHEAARSLGCEGFFDLTAAQVPEAMFRSTFEQVVAQFASRKRKPREAAVVEELRSAVHDLRGNA